MPPAFGHHHEAYASEPYPYHVGPYHHPVMSRMPYPSGHPSMYGAMESVNHMHEIPRPMYPGPVMMPHMSSIPIAESSAEEVVMHHATGMPKVTKSEYYAPRGKPEARSDEESDPYFSTESYRD